MSQDLVLGPHNSLLGGMEFVETPKSSNKFEWDLYFVSFRVRPPVEKSRDERKGVTYFVNQSSR